jgi:hypothetical protein
VVNSECGLAERERKMKNEIVLIAVSRAGDVVAHPFDGDNTQAMEAAQREFVRDGFGKVYAVPLITLAARYVNGGHYMKPGDKVLY